MEEGVWGGGGRGLGRWRKGSGKVEEGVWGGGEGFPREILVTLVDQGVKSGDNH